MSIELAMPKPDRLADDLAAILALGEDRPEPRPSRRRGVRAAVLLAGLAAIASGVAIFSVARLSPGGTQPDRAGAEAPVERAGGIVAEAAPADDRRIAEADSAAAPPRPPARRSDAMAAASAAPPRQEASRLTAAAARPALSPPTARGSARPDVDAAATVSPGAPAETMVAVARPPAPVFAPRAEVRAEAPARGEQVASAALPAAAPPLPADADEGQSKRAKPPIEERKVREGIDALRLLRRQ